MPAKSKENRVVVTLACDNCKERNYATEKRRVNRGNKPATPRLELNRYCPHCRQHHVHRETR